MQASLIHCQLSKDALSSWIKITLLFFYIPDIPYLRVLHLDHNPLQKVSFQINLNFVRLAFDFSGLLGTIWQTNILQKYFVHFENLISRLLSYFFRWRLTRSRWSLNLWVSTSAIATSDGSQQRPLPSWTASKSSSCSTIASQNYGKKP